MLDILDVLYPTSRWDYPLSNYILEGCGKYFCVFRCFPEKEEEKNSEKFASNSAYTRLADV